MDGIALFRLGRSLMKIGETAIHMAGFTQLPTSVRSILVDVFEHPGSSVGEITARTGFPQSHVSAAVARLRDGGALVTGTDPADRRRTLVGVHPDVARRAAGLASSAPVDPAVAEALGPGDPDRVAEVVAALETLARHLDPARAHRDGRGAGSPA
jgi:DNA-binding MarR family transcriptional regulator